jgi:hypothetical protein
MHLLKALVLFSVLLPETAWANERAWPRLDDAYPLSGICAEALEIANSAYRSDNFYLYALPPVAKDFSVALVLQPSAVDISGGDALIADPTVFRKIPNSNETPPGSVYWQTKAQHGLRYVISEEAFGWRGDQYTLYALKEDVTPDRFIKGIGDGVQKQAFSPLIGEGWRPPLMLQDRHTGDVWAIDVGAPYVYLSDWGVYSIGQDGAQRRCVIHFHPKAKTATALLPRPIQTLARYLDATLGSGANEGTLQPTARIRVEVLHMWANVAMRPWAALAAQPHNSRKRVDAGLRAYARKGARFRKLYRDIYADYPRAERALTRYYSAKFGKDAREARAVAKRALDIAFRMYLFFQKAAMIRACTHKCAMSALPQSGHRNTLCDAR